MIRVVIVDDDVRVARTHRDLVDSLPGFTVAAVAHTAAAALAAVEAQRPDLVLLDLYLPDESGISVLRSLRAPARAGTIPPVDVLVITAVRDVDQVRAALHGGAVHYLLKPFPLAALRDQLERYAAAHRSLDRIGEATQGDVDRLFGLLRPAPARSLPKGLTQATADLVAETLRAAGTDLSAAEVAVRSGVARVTARRYLEHLCAEGRAELKMRYGSTGRPEHRYHWVR
ncbi:response regulator [Marinactinospora thermotolerans]|uniref:Transcriptional regulatory protein n=1 Tax=Marinactinospora thermotolerans DSM 45154 TaxID=1122192 RepID=A0A1T4M229_9ACTN|nr:response regulator [Marinactinospora thermotolerans]SJZ60818.1 two-component system, CitB family, response regulator [Marinactinospora thermotolerans DSM 45154]